jgi:hypothetical protein
MPNRNDEKKRIESLVLGAARQAGAPIPVGERRGTEPTPDFWIDTDDGGLGVELTEFLCPGDNGNAMLPVEEEKFHRQIIRIAQQQYYAAVGAFPARAHVIFANSRGVHENKQHMARTLCEYVRANLHRAKPAVAADRPKMPPGFASISITSESDDWWSDECVGTTVPEVWAIGECAGSPQFTHASMDDFRVIRDNLAGGARTTTGRETQGFMKALIAPDTGRILGFTMIGPESGEVIAVVQMAM